MVTTHCPEGHVTGMMRERLRKMDPKKERERVKGKGKRGEPRERTREWEE
jgi:hypothetical protein